jgi:hypothetical protein
MDAPHIAPGSVAEPRHPPEALEALPSASVRLWNPRRVLLTRAARVSRIRRGRQSLRGSDGRRRSSVSGSWRGVATVPGAM